MTVVTSGGGGGGGGGAGWSIGAISARCSPSPSSWPGCSGCSPPGWLPGAARRGVRRRPARHAGARGDPPVVGVLAPLELRTPLRGRRDLVDLSYIVGPALGATLAIGLPGPWPMWIVGGLWVVAGARCWLLDPVVRQEAGQRPRRWDRPRAGGGADRHLRLGLPPHRHRAGDGCEPATQRTGPMIPWSTPCGASRRSRAASPTARCDARCRSRFWSPGSGRPRCPSRSPGRGGGWPC